MKHEARFEYLACFKANTCKKHPRNLALVRYFWIKLALKNGTKSTFLRIKPGDLSSFSTPSLLQFQDLKFDTSPGKRVKSTEDLIQSVDCRSLPRSECIQFEKISFDSTNMKFLSDFKYFKGQKLSQIPRGSRSIPCCYRPQVCETVDTPIMGMSIQQVPMCMAGTLRKFI